MALVRAQLSHGGDVDFKNAVAAGGRILNAPYPAARESSGIYRSADHAEHNVAQYTA